MTLPLGVTLGRGRKLPVSQRGWFTKAADGTQHFTACMFAGLAQILERVGYRMPLGRDIPLPGQPDNFVHTLQKAGDPTPLTGSSMRQSQTALRKLLPDAPVLFGTMSETELFEALAKGATVRIIVDCSKLPRERKRWVGQGFMGGHAVTVDGISGSVVDWTDPMYRPAKAIKAEPVEWSTVSSAVKRNANGIVVTLGYENTVVPVDPLAELREQNETLARELMAVQTDRNQLTADLAATRQELATTKGALAQVHGIVAPFTPEGN